MTLPRPDTGTEQPLSCVFNILAEPRPSRKSLWLRHQPHSALSLWFKVRVKQNNGRLKKSTIVALARKLLVALWKYLNAGVVIEGTVMKAA